MQNPVLKVQKLNYSYSNEKKALSDINIDIFKGEKIAVLGSNGAGKSTLFLTLNGVLTPDSGKIFYNGIEINHKNINDLRRNVGIVFQDADNQIIASTVLAEVSFGPINLKLSKEEVKNRVEEALHFMNLSEFKNRPPHYLSGGEKKRVSIADIIAMKPEVVIFDEPTASLDSNNSAILEKILFSMSNEYKTILVSTHDVDFAYRWAERVIVFHDGCVLADSTPIGIFNNKYLLEKANLKRPMLLDIYNILLNKKLISKLNDYPRTIDDFNSMF